MILAGGKSSRRRRCLETSGEHARAQEEQERRSPSLDAWFCASRSVLLTMCAKDQVPLARQMEREMARQMDREADRDIELERQRRIRSRDYRSRTSRTIRSARSRSPSTDHREIFTMAEHGTEMSRTAMRWDFPLRRMGRRTITDGPLPSSSLRQTWSPVSTVDGLGDRQRSVSPLVEEHPPWDNFTTVVPDPVGPTTESSFASTAAAASFSNSLPSSRAAQQLCRILAHSHNGSLASWISKPCRSIKCGLVIRLRRGILQDMDTEDEATTRPDRNWTVDGRPATFQGWHGAAVRFGNTRSGRSRGEIEELDISVSGRRRLRPSYFSDEPPARDADRYSNRVIGAALCRASDYVPQLPLPEPPSPRHGRAGFADYRMISSDGPTEQSRGEETPSTGDETVPLLVSADWPQQDQELRDARALLERLSRREDISDNFWASVGLTRSFADLNAVVERPERESERDV